MNESNADHAHCYAEQYYVYWVRMHQINLRHLLTSYWSAVPTE